MNQRFDLEKTTHALIEYCRVQLQASGGERAVIGISGGKDSSVVAALMAAAIGPERVHGVLLPDGDQADIADAHALCDHLHIQQHNIPIDAITDMFQQEIVKHVDMTKQAQLNLPPRVRMTMLFGLAQCLVKARVINTSNLSEDWVGYATLHGDTAGAFAPLAMLTSQEVMSVGVYLGLPRLLAEKIPADGLTGKTDEDIFGFTYDELNRYIRTGKIGNLRTKKRIDRLHRTSRFKFLPIPMFDPRFPIKATDVAGVYGLTES